MKRKGGVMILHEFEMTLSLFLLKYDKNLSKYT